MKSVSRAKGNAQSSERDWIKASRSRTRPGRSSPRSPMNWGFECHPKCSPPLIRRGVAEPSDSKSMGYTLVSKSMGYTLVGLHAFFPKQQMKFQVSPAPRKLWPHSRKKLQSRDVAAVSRPPCFRAKWLESGRVRPGDRTHVRHPQEPNQVSAQEVRFRPVDPKLPCEHRVDSL